MKTTIKLFSLGLVSALAFSSCSDSFLEEKKNYDNVNKDIYNYYEGCNGRLNDIYLKSATIIQYTIKGRFMSR